MTDASVFLDWDGVLIQADGQWSPFAMAELNRLCLETGAAIVLSTSLRYARSVDQLHAAMLENGFAASIPVLGETRDLNELRDAARRGRWH